MPPRTPPPRRPAREWLRGWRAAAALGPALVVLLLGALISASEQGYTRSFARVEEGVRTESAVERAFSALRDVEIGQRGFLISGDSQYLASYEAHKGEVRRGVEALLRAPSGLEHQEALRDIADLTERRIARLDSGIAIMLGNGGDPAHAFVGLPAGRAIMDSIRARIDTLQVARERNIAAWRDTERVYHRWLDLGVFLGTPLAVILALIGTTSLARSERTQRVLTEQALRDNEVRRTAEQAVHRGAVRARVLADAGAALSSSLDAEQALDATARSAVPGLADLCIVDLVRLDGHPRRVAVAHQDPEVVRLVRDAAGQGDATGLPMEEAIRTNRPVFIPADAGRTLEAATHDAARLAAIRAADIGSLVSVPLQTRNATVGALTLVRSRARPEPFTEEDLATATELARRTASAIETARVFRIAVAARAEAEEANRAKSTFLATMSHELRTPLNAVLGYVDLLDAEVAGPLTVSQRDYIRRVRTSGRHLLNLIAEILDLAKVEAGQMQVRRDAVRAAPVIGSALELVRPLADTRRITLELQCAPTIALLGDEDRVRQIVLNLLSNAVKFTGPGGRVTVECTDADLATDATARLPGEGPWIGIAVRDTGRGIPSEKLEAIFAPFVQVDSGHTREVGGTGLGLSISRSFARLMDGDLTVASQMGAGSTFTLWLPAARGRAASEQALAAAEVRATGAERRIEVGRALGSRSAEVVRHLTERLRNEAEIPGGQMISQADLEDHLAGFITDLAQSLTIVDAPEGADRAGLARDGDALQYAFAVRHGAQRRRLGWPESALRREYALLADEIERAVRRSFGRELDGIADDVLPLLRRLNEAAMERAVEGYRS